MNHQIRENNLAGGGEHPTLEGGASHFYDGRLSIVGRRTAEAYHGATFADDIDESDDGDDNRDEDDPLLQFLLDSPLMEDYDEGDSTPIPPVRRPSAEFWTDMDDIGRVQQEVSTPAPAAAPAVAAAADTSIGNDDDVAELLLDIANNTNKARNTSIASEDDLSKIDNIISTGVLDDDMEADIPLGVVVTDDDDSDDSVGSRRNSIAMAGTASNNVGTKLQTTQTTRKGQQKGRQVKSSVTSATKREYVGPSSKPSKRAKINKVLPEYITHGVRGYRVQPALGGRSFYVGNVDTLKEAIAFRDLVTKLYTDIVKRLNIKRDPTKDEQQTIVRNAKIVAMSTLWPGHHVSWMDKGTKDKLDEAKKKRQEQSAADTTTKNRDKTV
mmetsp:Transcript_15971/g.34722  ORF Transcript_15971/g.34722 Transcript_15971/m.34722 type:complete len:383 (+) Transcript_15971:207-1355(+)|eukprot:CAMPEP_0178494374 /NCGR_PEP_ID=MMETSP0696-20121128/12980_1 /TAXON_ID=265572 /ORGANISM="Extubocellulus spinifer, Strain CCMP396" /LENGTH=382 /DNA_ID=CAMNT_0020122447 /DNA_START=187 /DNA_END=1335 /DNA_ORIENTATION=-